MAKGKSRVEPAVAQQVEATETVTEHRQSDVTGPTESNKMETNVTVSRKVKKVAYNVTFPDPKVTALSDEQKAIAVQSFFTARVGYLLRQSVATETDSIQAFKKLYDSMVTLMKSMPTFDGNEAPVIAFVTAHLKATVLDFRLEPAASYTFGLDKIFEPPKETEADADAENEDADETEEK